MKTKEELTLETGFQFIEGMPSTQKTSNGIFKYINGTLFHAYDLGRWEIYSKVEINQKGVTK